MAIILIYSRLDSSRKRKNRSHVVLKNYVECYSSVIEIIFYVVDPFQFKGRILSPLKVFPRKTSGGIDKGTLD